MEITPSKKRTELVPMPKLEIEGKLKHPAAEVRIPRTDGTSVLLSGWLRIVIYSSRV